MDHVKSGKLAKKPALYSVTSIESYDYLKVSSQFSFPLEEVDEWHVIDIHNLMETTLKPLPEFEKSVSAVARETNNSEAQADFGFLSLLLS